MALYKDLPNRPEDSADPEKTVERVLDIASVLFHLEQVRLAADSVWFAPPVDGKEDVCVRLLTTSKPSYAQCIHHKEHRTPSP